MRGFDPPVEEKMSRSMASDLRAMAIHVSVAGMTCVTRVAATPPPAQVEKQAGGKPLRNAETSVLSGLSHAQEAISGFHQLLQGKDIELV